MTHLFSNRERFFLGIIALLAAAVMFLISGASVSSVALGITLGVALSLLVSSITTETSQ
jgi:hypothetical protein